MSWKFLSHFSSLIPSWRFFDRTGNIAQLSYRTQLSNREEPGPWILFEPQRPQSLSRWVFNPQGNLIQYQHSLIQRFAEEFTETDKVESLVSFQLLQRMVQKEVSPSTTNLQWKITLWPNQLEIYTSPLSQVRS